MNPFHWILLLGLFQCVELAAIENDMNKFRNKHVNKSRSRTEKQISGAVDSKLHFLALLFQFTSITEKTFNSIGKCNFKPSRKFGYLAGTLASAGFLALYPECIDPIVSTRLSSALLTTASICADYRISELAHSSMTRCHERSAAKLRELCAKNGGMFIKAAQHLSSMDHLLPTAYIRELSCLQDQAPVSSFDRVKELIREELGMSVEEIFSDIDSKPIGSASIGQVHLARLKTTGEQVAVKIQHPNIKRDSEIDLKAFNYAFKMVKLLLPDTNFEWISEELRECLDSEMDFLREAENSKKAKKSFESNPKFNSLVIIPKVYDEFTSKRILTMEFVPGCKINDLKSLEAAQIDTEEVNRIMYTLFMEMIFKHGFVHCDPHPGNILVHIDASNNDLKLVLLDHGLYKEITPEIGMTFSKLFLAILRGNEQEIGQLSEEMNIPHEFLDELMKLVQTLKSAACRNRGNNSVNHTLRRELLSFLQKQSETSKRQASEALKSIPKELLFIIRILDLLRSNERKLATKSKTQLMPNSLMIISAYCMATVEQGDPPNAFMVILRLFYNYLKSHDKQ